MQPRSNAVEFCQWEKGIADFFHAIYCSLGHLAHPGIGFIKL